MRLRVWFCSFQCFLYISEVIEGESEDCWMSDGFKGILAKQKCKKGRHNFRGFSDQT